MQDRSVIVFDFDGTLVNSNHIKTQGFYDVIESSAFQRNLMSSILESNPGDRSQIFIEFLSRLPEVKPIDLDNAVSLLVKKYSDYVDELVINAPEIQGAESLLSVLKQKKKNIVLSSATPESNLKKIISRKGWDKYFDDIFGMPRYKKDTLLYVLKKYDVSKKDVFVVGDGVDDRLSAENIGCTFLPVGAIKLMPYETKLYSLEEVKEIVLKVK